jgi:hypothetical protein
MHETICQIKDWQNKYLSNKKKVKLFHTHLFSEWIIDMDHVFFIGHEVKVFLMVFLLFIFSGAM